MWGTVPLFVQGSESPAALLNVLQLAIGGLMLLLVVIAKRMHVTRAQVAPLVIYGVVFAVHMATLFEALKLLPGATAVLVMYIFPLVVAVAAPIVLHEAREPHVVP